MNWLSQGTIDELASFVAEHEVAIERAHEQLENHRKAAYQVMEVLHRHQGLAAEAKFLLTIAHGAAPIPSPGEIREVAGEDEGLGLAIGSIRMALPPDASTAQYGQLAESMRALYAAAHVVALHADERARTSAPPQPRLAPETEAPAAVPRALASLMGCQVRVDNADGTHDVGLLSSVEGGQLTLLDEDGVPVAWPLLDEVLAVRAWPPPDGADEREPDEREHGAPERDPDDEPADALGGSGREAGDQAERPRTGGVVSLVRRGGRARSAAGM
ncbi:hypothetical protein SAMN05443665_100669 [Actinomadura meyerae]|jgi:hypothetical protein|uniref:Uncharacterized protein n=1 Tax=Actinomadura meyerae TaxID=240840 RepID=A0A239FNP9_9ACTN|nr:hypothetical protein [Actinomadura meyerae]SNS57564.1 hypothetical protein SAMN05443665_100669 [Actinomadura meyerae]